MGCDKKNRATKKRRLFSCVCRKGKTTQYGKMVCNTVCAFLVFVLVIGLSPFVQTAQGLTQETIATNLQLSAQSQGNEQVDQGQFSSNSTNGLTISQKKTHTRDALTNVSAGNSYIEDSLIGRTSLGEFSWEELVYIAKDIAFSNTESKYFDTMWNIMCSKDSSNNSKSIAIQDNDLNTYYCSASLVQVGNHDGDLSGLTFQFHGDYYPSESLLAGLPLSTIESALSGSDGQSYYQTNLFRTIKADYQRNVLDEAGMYGALQDNIIPLDKTCAYGPQQDQLRLLNLKFWLPSATEINGSGYSSNVYCPSEGSVYESINKYGQTYYGLAQNCVNTANSWLRSPCFGEDGNNTESWYVVQANEDGVGIVEKSRNTKNEVCPCFSLGISGSEEHYIHYNLDHGSFENVMYVQDVPTSYLEGETVTLPDQLIRGRSIFLGWYNNAAFEGSPITEISSDSISDVYLYAKWEDKLCDYSWEDLITIAHDIENQGLDSSFYERMWNILIAGDSGDCNSCVAKELVKQEYCTKTVTVLVTEHGLDPKDEREAMKEQTCEVVLVHIGSHASDTNPDQNDAGGLVFQIQGGTTAGNALPNQDTLVQACYKEKEAEQSQGDLYYNRYDCSKVYYAFENVYKICDLAGEYGTLSDNVCTIIKACDIEKDSPKQVFLPCDLWLPSLTEYNGDLQEMIYVDFLHRKQKGFVGEGSKYTSVSPDGTEEYDGLKMNHRNANSWWTRTPNIRDYMKWKMVSCYGEAGDQLRVDARGICPCFVL